MIEDIRDTVGGIVTFSNGCILNTIICSWCKAESTDDGGWMLRLGKWYCPDCIGEFISHYE